MEEFFLVQVQGGTTNTKYYNHAGGITGYNSGNITNSYNSGGISVYTERVNINGKGSSTGYVGGISGKNDGSGKKVDNCYNSGSIFVEKNAQASQNVGGIVGVNSQTAISNCLNLGLILPQSQQSIGGLLGAYGGTIENCYYLSANQAFADSADISGVKSILDIGSLYMKVASQISISVPSDINSVNISLYNKIFLGEIESEVGEKSSEVDDNHQYNKYTFQIIPDEKGKSSLKVFKVIHSSVISDLGFEEKFYDKPKDSIVELEVEVEDTLSFGEARIENTDGENIFTFPDFEIRSISESIKEAELYFSKPGDDSDKIDIDLSKLSGNLINVSKEIISGGKKLILKANKTPPEDEEGIRQWNSVWQDVLRTCEVHLNNEASAADLYRTLRINLKTQVVQIYENSSKVRLYKGNGHYYEFKEAVGISWKDAKNRASERILDSNMRTHDSYQAFESFYKGQKLPDYVKGYLASITSNGEQNFIASVNEGFSWVGASSDYDELVEAGVIDSKKIPKEKYSAEQGNIIYAWVTGNEKGRVIWKQSSPRPQGKTSSLSGYNYSYSNWSLGCPNYNESKKYVAMMYTFSNYAWENYDNSEPILTGYTVEWGEEGDLVDENYQKFEKTVKEGQVSIEGDLSANSAPNKVTNALGNVSLPDMVEPNYELPQDNEDGVKFSWKQNLGTSGSYIVNGKTLSDNSTRDIIRIPEGSIICEASYENEKLSKTFHSIKILPNPLNSISNLKGIYSNNSRSASISWDRVEVAESYKIYYTSLEGNNILQETDSNYIKLNNVDSSKSVYVQAIRHKRDRDGAPINDQFVYGDKTQAILTMENDPLIELTVNKVLSDGEIISESSTPDFNSNILTGYSSLIPRGASVLSVLGKKESGEIVSGRLHLDDTESMYGTIIDDNSSREYVVNLNSVDPVIEGIYSVKHPSSSSEPDGLINISQIFSDGLLDTLSEYSFSIDSGVSWETGKGSKVFDNLSDGTYNIRIGIKKSNGEVETKWEKNVLLSANSENITVPDVIIDKSEFIYNGKEQYPNISLMGGSTSVKHFIKITLSDGTTQIDNPISSGEYKLKVYFYDNSGYVGYKDFDFKIKKRKVALFLRDQIKLEGEDYNNALEIVVMDKYDGLAPGHNLENLGKPIIYYKDSDGNIVNNLKILSEGEYDIIIDNFIEGDNNYEIFFNNAKLYVYCNKLDENGESSSLISDENEENSSSISDLNVETCDSVDILEYLLVNLLSFILIIFLMRRKKARI